MYEVNRLGLCLTMLGGVLLLIAAAYAIKSIRRTAMNLKDIKQRTELLDRAEAKNFVNAKDHAALTEVVNSHVEEPNAE